jgi:hypothetical protein
MPFPGWVLQRAGMSRPLRFVVPSEGRHFPVPILSHKLNCIHAARVEAFPLQHARFAVREEPLRYAEHCFRVRARFRFLFCFVSFKARKMTAAVLVRYIVMRFPEPLARIEIKDAAK